MALDLNAIGFALNAAKAAVATDQANIAEYNRQYTVNLQKFNSNSGAVQAQAKIDVDNNVNSINYWANQLKTDQAALNVAQTAYNSAYGLDVNGNPLSSGTVTTPTISVTSPTITLTSPTVSMTQGTTKYLIWGAIALVVIVVAIYIYKRHFNKAA